VLESLQNVPDKGQLQLLLFADAVRPHEDRGFVAVFPECRGPFHSGQDTTFSCKFVHLEMSVDQYLAPLAEVLQRVGLDIRVCVLQAVEVSLLIRTPLLFQDLGIFMGFAFVWAKQQKVGFSRTLGIRDNDCRRNDGFHDDPPTLLRDGCLCLFDAVMGWD
jgi:hypothetical protein